MRILHYAARTAVLLTVAELGFAAFLAAFAGATSLFPNKFDSPFGIPAALAFLLIAVVIVYLAIQLAQGNRSGQWAALAFGIFLLLDTGFELLRSSGRDDDGMVLAWGCIAIAGWYSSRRLASPDNRPDVP